jgi:hypothetical protein
MRFLALLVLAAGLSGMLVAPSHAQQNNRPYSFGSVGGGLGGIGPAGRQAIVLQKLGVVPDNIFRDFDGSLGIARRGPSGVVLSTGRNGVDEVGVSRGRFSQGAGVFNSFFVKYRGSGRGAGPVQGTTSGATIDNWTDSVFGVVRSRDNTVDGWTGMVYFY